MTYTTNPAKSQQLNDEEEEHLNATATLNTKTCSNACRLK